MTGNGQKVTLVDTAPRGRVGSMTRYGRHVAEGLRHIAPALYLNTLRLGLPFSMLAPLPRGLATWIHHGWMLTVGVKVLAGRRAGLVHVLDGSYAYVARGVGADRLVVTCHDVIPLLQIAGVLPGQQGRLARRIVRSSLDVIRGARMILAVSENTRNDLIHAASMRGDNISVVHQALDPGFCPVDCPSERTSPPYILHVGGDSPYKNRGAVLRVFERVRESCAVELILAGEPPSPELKRLLEVSPARNYVRMCVNPGDDRLRELYSGASVLLFPSLYEGFGWPVLEAMACGCPVVCSHVASLSEIAAGVAFMAAPNDDHQLALHCLTLLQSSRVAEEARVKGRLRAGSFTLDRMAKQVLSVYSKAGLIAQE